MTRSGQPISTWAAWPQSSDSAASTIGIEEELMLLSPDGWNLAQASDVVLDGIAPEIRDRVAPETHEGAIEIETVIHRSVAAAVDDLEQMRRSVAMTAAELGLRVGSSATHPFTVWSDTEVGGGVRQTAVYGSMRELAHREPTFALHVHVGVPNADEAVTAFNRMRVHLPMLLALSADSPFWQGRDTGLASARTPLFQGFPRVGIPRRFADYDDWVTMVDLLVECEAFPDPSYLWWDIRMQPALGTVEIRIMDAQIDTVSTAALVALVRCLVRMELREGRAEGASHAPQEVWEENRFIAARDGHRARLISPITAQRVPVAALLDDLLPVLHDHATDLDCEGELDAVRDLASGHTGAMRQRTMAERAGNLPGLVSQIADLL